MGYGPFIRRGEPIARPLLPIKASDPTITKGASAQQLMSSVLIGINYAAMMKSTVINVSSGVAATRNDLSTYSLQSCADSVIGGVGQKKFDLLKQEAPKAIAALNLKWPGGGGGSVLVVAAPNCPMTIHADDPDFYDLWMNGRTNTQPIVVVGGLGIQTSFVTADFSARGDLIDIGAPATGFNVLNFRQATGVESNATGNSFAAPLVAGTIGLMVAQDSTLSGQADKLKARLLCNAPSKSGVDFAGQRVLDAFLAVGNGNACP